MRIKCRKKFSHALHIATLLWRGGREKVNGSLKTTQCTRRKGNNNVVSKTTLWMNGDRSKHVIPFDKSPYVVARFFMLLYIPSCRSAVQKVSKNII